MALFAKNLGTLKLYNYQQIIYLSLFQYKHQPTILATPKEQDRLTAPLMADHFSHLIEDFRNIKHIVPIPRSEKR